MFDARNEIYTRMGSALGALSSDTWDDIPRNYRQSSELPQRELIELLKDRLHDYDAQFLESSSAGATEAVAQMLRERGIFRIVIPKGLPPFLLPDGFSFIEDENLSHAALNACEGILTQSTLAIAETGTIVLQNVPGQGRRAATLVPDYHLCLVNATDIVATVPEGIARLRATAHLPTTFISGPSATADIEMTRIKGVHGPRFLDVILLLG